MYRQHTVNKLRAGNQPSPLPPRSTRKQQKMSHSGWVSICLPLWDACELRARDFYGKVKIMLCMALCHWSRYTDVQCIKPWGLNCCSSMTFVSWTYMCSQLHWVNCRILFKFYLTHELEDSLQKVNGQHAVVDITSYVARASKRIGWQGNKGSLFWLIWENKGFLCCFLHELDQLLNFWCIIRELN